MSFGLYRGNEVSVIFGVLPLKDMRADQFLNIRADEESFGVIKGSDGSITRYATENTLIHVDYTCKRSSNDHQRLSALHNADVVTPGGAGVASFLVKDNQGATLLSGEQAWLVGYPDAGSAKDVGPDVTWTFDVKIPKGTYIIGGNQIA